MSTSSSRPRILQATARNRLLVSYPVSPPRVGSRLPRGLEPDLRDGQAYVDLVGVELVKVRVLGLVGPGFRRVPAVELQVPVRESHTSARRRGTFTVQAYVPRHLVAWGARRLYGERVSVASMQPVWRERTDTIEATYRFDRAGREQRLRALGEKPPVMPARDTQAFFLMNRGWRFGRRRDGSLVRSCIERPIEAVYRTREYHVTMQWASVFGEEWSFLADEDPTLIFLSPGGPVTLRWREPVTS